MAHTVIMACPIKLFLSSILRTINYQNGITLEFEDDSKPLSAAQQLKNKKGRVEISYKNYSINKGIAANIFN